MTNELRVGQNRTAGRRGLLSEAKSRERSESGVGGSFVLFLIFGPPFSSRKKVERIKGLD